MFALVGSPAASRIAEASPGLLGRPRLCACSFRPGLVSSQVREAPRGNAPYGARCFPATGRRSLRRFFSMSLNAPFGARDSLNSSSRNSSAPFSTSLNASFGARYFLTTTPCLSAITSLCLNAPFGARYFLTYQTLELLRHEYDLS